MPEASWVLAAFQLSLSFLVSGSDIRIECAPSSIVLFVGPFGGCDNQPVIVRVTTGHVDATGTCGREPAM